MPLILMYHFPLGMSLASNLAYKLLFIIIWKLTISKILIAAINPYVKKFICIAHVYFYALFLSYKSSMPWKIVDNLLLKKKSGFTVFHHYSDIKTSTMATS